jgi:hypothetical protein
MKTVLGLLVFLGIGMACFAQEGPVTVTYYAQLIRASDREKPQEVNWKPLGPKLTKQLCPKFRWKNYWEVSRQKLKVQPGNKARVRLNAEREIEVELSGKGESEIRLFAGGKLVQKSRQSLQSHMSIMGGTRENDESWFVVIRSDKPTVD